MICSEHRPQKKVRRIKELKSLAFVIFTKEKFIEIKAPTEAIDRGSRTETEMRIPQ